MSPDAYEPPPFEPYRPPWYPLDDNPQQIIASLSGDVVTNYEKWVRSLPAGELLRRVGEYHRSVETGLAFDRQAGRCVEGES